MRQSPAVTPADEHHTDLGDRSLEILHDERGVDSEDAVAGVGELAVAASVGGARSS